MATSRATLHNGRTKGSKHNDRNFDVKQADNIDSSRCANNVYWTFAQAKVKETDKDGNVTERDPKSFDEQEQAVYIDQFSEYLDNRNAKAIEGRHKNRVQTMEQFRKNRKACPEETIFSIGNAKSPCDPAVLKAVYEEYVKWYQDTFPNVILLNAAMHLDEASPHIQERKVWTAHEGGMLIISQEKALAEMGIERPDTSQPVGRHNNAKMVYTKICREKQIEIARAHGMEIEDTPREPSESGLSMNAYKKKKIEEDIDGLEGKKRELQGEVDGLQEQSDNAAETLGRNLKLAARAAEIKKPSLFKKKETVEVDKEAYEAVCAIVNDVKGIVASADKKSREADRAINEAHNMQRSIKPLYDKANKTYLQADESKKKNEQLTKDIERQIEQRAQALFEERVSKMFGDAQTKREKRLEEFCDKVKYKDGSSVLDAFKEKEEALKKGKIKGR